MTVIDSLIYTISAACVYLAGIFTVLMPQSMPDEKIIGWILGPTGVLVLGFFVIRWLINREKELREENRKLMISQLEDKMRDAEEKDKRIRDLEMLIKQIRRDDAR